MCLDMMTKDNLNNLAKYRLLPDILILDRVMMEGPFNGEAKLSDCRVSYKS